MLENGSPLAARQARPHRVSQEMTLQPSAAGHEIEKRPAERPGARNQQIAVARHAAAGRLIRAPEFIWRNELSRGCGQAQPKRATVMPVRGLSRSLHRSITPLWI
jgi:hypothetical protein